MRAHHHHSRHHGSQPHQPRWLRGGTSAVTAAIAAAGIAAATLVATAPAASAVPAPQPDWRVTHTLTTSQNGPRAIALSPDGLHAYVSHEDDGTVGVLDLATGPVIDLAVDEFIAEPLLTVPAEGGYRVLAAGVDDVHSITPGSWSVDAAESPGIEAFARSGATGLVYSVDGGFQLSERDPQTGALLRFAALDDYQVMPALAAHPTQHVLYTTSSYDGTVTAIDLSLVEFWDPCWCDSSATDAGGPSPFTVLGLGDLEPVDVATSSDGGTLYVLGSAGEIAVVGTADFTLSYVVPVVDGMTPSPSLSVNPVTGEIIVADLLGSLAVVDPATFAATTVALDEGLWDTAVSDDGTRIVVTNTWEHTVSVLQRLAAPPAPATDVQATGGARQAWVTWQASPTVDPELHYSVTVGDRVLCTTTTTSCFVTGLAPGSAQFTVVTTSEGGSAPSLPSAPVTITAPAAPATVPGASTPGASIGFGGGGATTATVGAQVEVTASGFAPGTYVDVSLHSLPLLLGSGLVGAGGSVTFSVTIPAGVTAGAHHLVASGFTGAGLPAAAVRAITLSPGSGSGPGIDELARTGAPITIGIAPGAGWPAPWVGAMLAAAGLVLLTAQRMRARASV